MRPRPRSAQAEHERDRYLAKADELRDDAMHDDGEVPLESAWSVIKSWWMQPRSMRTTPARSTRPSRQMALERKHDGQARWVALTIGNTFRTLFGKSMYGLTATITSVVLGREIELRTVRQWLKTRLESSHPVICGNSRPSAPCI